MKYKESFSQKNCSLNEFLRLINLNNPKLKKIEALLHGTFQSTKYGTGFDFNEIREYKIGDDLRHISWTTTAKTGDLHTKEYFAEKEIRSYFLVDISNSMFCGNKLDPFIKLTAFLLNSVCSFSEKIGGLFFSDDIKYHFPLKHSATQSNIMFSTLMSFFNNLNEKITTESSFTNVSKVLEFTVKDFHKVGMVFLISDFINLNVWEKNIYEVSQKHNVYSFQIYDTLDFTLTKAGYLNIIDPETNKRIIVNTDSKKVQAAYNSLMREKQEKLQLFLKQINAKHFVIDKEDFVCKII